MVVFADRYEHESSLQFVDIVIMNFTCTYVARLLTLWGTQSVRRLQLADLIFHNAGL